MTVTIVGAGYVGLVAAACFAASGRRVICVERDPLRLQQLLQGQLPLHEPGLPPLVSQGVTRGLLRFTSDMAGAVCGTDVVFLAVGTPCGPDGGADTSDLIAAARQVAAALTGPAILVTKSTAPVGTHRQIAAAAQAVTNHRIVVASNPEFLREGHAVDDFLHPERVVIGTTDPAAEQALRALYAPFAPGAVHVMDPASAELAKYAANTMLAARVAMINELAALCEVAGADIASVAQVVGSDSRIGPAFLQPSAGYGGSCLPKDVLALASMGRSAGIELRLATATHEANEAHRQRWTQRIRSHLSLRHPSGPAGCTVAVWGLAFKDGTDDLRHSSAVALVEALLAHGVTIRAHDPLALDRARAALGERVSWCTDPLWAIRGADALVIGTEWPGYAQIPIEALRDHLSAGATVFDGRNLLSPERFVGTGLGYVSIGRPDQLPAQPSAEAPCPAFS